MFRNVRVFKIVAMLASLFSNIQSQVFNVIENPQKILENYEVEYKILS